MAEQRRENSLLVSLRELRTIEDDRVKEEEDDVRKKAEAEARAREDTIRRAKEEEERKEREAEAAALKKKMDELQGLLGKATSEVERQRIQRQMEEARRDSAVRRGTKKGTKSGDSGKINTSGDDPLGNLPGMN